MPATEIQLQRLTLRSIQSINSLRGTGSRKEIAVIMFVNPVKDEGYDFDATVSEFCQIAVANNPADNEWIAFGKTAPGTSTQGSFKPSDQKWFLAVSMLAIWNDYNVELIESGYISDRTAKRFLSDAVQTAIRKLHDAKEVHGPAQASNQSNTTLRPQPSFCPVTTVDPKQN